MVVLPEGRYVIEHTITNADDELEEVVMQEVAGQLVDPASGVRGWGEHILEIASEQAVPLMRFAVETVADAATAVFPVAGVVIRRLGSSLLNLLGGNNSIVLLHSQPRTRLLVAPVQDMVIGQPYTIHFPAPLTGNTGVVNSYAGITPAFTDVPGYDPVSQSITY